MGKLRPVHLIEALVWLSITAIFFIYSFEFNKKIEIYKFGATAWPRSILLMLVLVIVGNLFYQKANGSEAQPGRVGIAEDNIDDADKSLHSFLNIGSFLILPLNFAWSLNNRLLRTPIFTALVIMLLGERSPMGYRYHTFYLHYDNTLVYGCFECSILRARYPLSMILALSCSV